MMIIGPIIYGALANVCFSLGWIADTAVYRGRAKGSGFTWHVKGNLSLTGDQWSSNYRIDDRGKPIGYQWYFDFNEGLMNNQPSGWPYSSSGMRALCVRRSAE